jgi:hypothetical protein
MTDRGKVIRPVYVSDRDKLINARSIAVKPDISRKLQRAETRVSDRLFRRLKRRHISEANYRAITYRIPVFLNTTIQASIVGMTAPYGIETS